jgi:glycosyltransferase involved in cell wall biosynthesis
VKICIDATPIGVKTTDKGGVYQYIFKLIEAISLMDQRNRYTLFFNFFKLVDPYSSSSIAEGIYKILKDNKLREELAMRGLERAKFFSWEKTARETLKVYQEVCQR